MRKVELEDGDSGLFHYEIHPSDDTYMIKHMDAFKRMWQEQVISYSKIFPVTFKWVV